MRAVAALGLWLAVLPGCGLGAKGAVDCRIVPQPGTPHDASVIIDEEFVGPMYWVAANTLRIPVGTHRITVEKVGYFPWDHVVVADRKPIRLDVTLAPVPD
ncbi:PEGA domain-containing protein [Myxococcota bacterium]